MYKKKLCLGLFSEFSIPIEDQIRLFGQVGFEAFFSGWDQNIKSYKKLADDSGMVYQSVHAPFGNAAKMWQSGENAEKATQELLTCVRDCSAAEVPVLVVHPYIGFEETEHPTKEGIENFGRVVDEAQKCGVKVAFENVEGESYLDALMKAFSSCGAVK